MNLPILHIADSDNIKHFIEYWFLLYHYPKDNLYLDIIKKNTFEGADIKNLFEWKNGMPLEGSGGKEKSLQDKILNRIETINKYKNQNEIDLDNFNNDFSTISAVWRIFLLHIINPKVYPIYDQHIHRTYNFIHNLEWQSINNTISCKRKLDFYYTTYLPYVQSLGVTDLKAMDESFFAFGQFLNTRRQKEIFRNSYSDI